MNREQLRKALAHPNVAAFIRVIREGESRQDDLAYRMRFGGHGKPPAYFDSFDDHPRIFEATADGRRSSAAGAPQATATTWDEERAKWKWPDFSPDCQDEFFVARFIYRSALDAIRAGRFEEACRLCKREWTSLPGGAEQNAATKRARETYTRYGGTFAAAEPVEPPVDTPAFDPDSLATEHYEGREPYEFTPATKEPKMVPVPLILAGLEVIKSLFPVVSNALKNENVPERNVQIGAALIDAVTKATNSPNGQAAIEAIQSDPEAKRAAEAALYQVLPTLTEVGGGVKAAREAEAQYLSTEWWRFLVVPHFWIAMILLAFVGAALGGVIGLWGWQGWTDQTRSNVVFGIVGTALGAVGGYYFGQSARADAQRATDKSVTR